MKKIYYIFFKGNTEFVGVEKKINNQIQALNVYFDCQKLAIYREKYQLLNSLLWRLPFGSFGMHYEQVWEQIDNPDCFYIRSMLADRKYIQFIKELRIRYPRCKILIEIPTYPYIHEWKSAPSMLPFYIKDMWHQRYLKKYVNRIVTFWKYNRIYDIPVIATINGIDISKIKVIDPRQYDKDEIHIIGVAMLQRHHGFERLIEGMRRYYADKSKTDSRKIFFHIVGDGPEKKKYEDLVCKYSLEDKVIFYGMLTGDRLDEVYKKCDLAVASLGMYKIKLDTLAALKVGEYLAKGLPVICGCHVNVFDVDFPFYLEFSNDSSMIDIEKIISFFDKIYNNSNGNREEIINSIRSYAERKVSMDVAMKPVVQYIEESQEGEI